MKYKNVNIVSHACYIKRRLSMQQYLLFSYCRSAIYSVSASGYVMRLVARGCADTRDHALFFELSAKNENSGLYSKGEAESINSCSPNPKSFIQD